MLENLNQKPFKKLPGNRQRRFNELDKPELHPLPEKRFEFAQWRSAKVNIDYHVAFHIRDRHYHYYSVPYPLVQREVQIRFTNKTIEIFLNDQRVAAHQRDDRPGKHTTLDEHMPESHKRHLQWTPNRIVNWAEKIGTACAQVTQNIMDNRLHPEQGFRSCLGVIRLGKRYGNDRLESACKRALALNLASFKSIKNMLEANQDKLPLPQDKQITLPGNLNSHIRRSNYYK